MGGPNLTHPHCSIGMQFMIKVSKQLANVSKLIFKIRKLLRPTLKKVTYAFPPFFEYLGTLYLFIHYLYDV